MSERAVRIYRRAASVAILGCFVGMPFAYFELSFREPRTSGTFPLFTLAWAACVFATAGMFGTEWVRKNRHEKEDRRREFRRWL